MSNRGRSRRNLITLMTLSFVVGLSVTPVIYVGIQVVGIVHSTSIENAIAPKRTPLSDKVWLLATSGTNVMLADGDGMGLIYGDVVMAGYLDHNKNTLIVVYVPYVRGADSSADALGKLMAAEVDLATGQASDRSAVTQRELTKLQGVFAFMDNQ